MYNNGSLENIFSVSEGEKITEGKKTNIKQEQVDNLRETSK